MTSYLQRESPRIASPLFTTTQPPKLGSLWQLWIGKRIQVGEVCGGGFAPARWHWGWRSPGAPGSALVQAEQMAEMSLAMSGWEGTLLVPGPAALPIRNEAACWVGSPD